MNNQYYTDEFEQNAFKQLVAEIESALIANENGPSWQVRKNGVRIYTRDSQDESKAYNGGDYNYYTIFYVESDGRVASYETWSADFDYGDPAEKVYGVITFDGLVALVAKCAADVWEKRDLKAGKPLFSLTKEESLISEDDANAEMPVVDTGKFEATFQLFEEDTCSIYETGTFDSEKLARAWVDEMTVKLDDGEVFIFSKVKPLQRYANASDNHVSEFLESLGNEPLPLSDDTLNSLKAREQEAAPTMSDVTLTYMEIRAVVDTIATLKAEQDRLYATVRELAAKLPDVEPDYEAELGKLRLTKLF